MSRHWMPWGNDGHAAPGAGTLWVVPCRGGIYGLLDETELQARLPLVSYQATLEGVGPQQQPRWADRRALRVATPVWRPAGWAAVVAGLAMAISGAVTAGESEAGTPIMGEEAMPKFDQPLTGAQAAAFSKLALDYARAAGNGDLEELLIEKSLAYFAADRQYPVNYEPGGEDFFSAPLAEADLMRRVLPPTEYSGWLDGFFPGLRQANLGRLLEPATVSDVTDGKIVHLAGLNLHRAWTMRSVAWALPAGDLRAQVLLEAAGDHLAAGLDYVFSGHYEGEHWLATFAVYGLTGVDAAP